MSRNDHAQSVQRLFDAKAEDWSSKYKSSSRGAAALGWRVDVFTRTVGQRRPAPARVLDFGCGTGDLAHALAERGYQVTGCDVSEPMLAQARAAFGDRLRWVALDPATTRLPFPDEELDVVVASSVLEYVADVDALFGEWARVLRPSGLLVATVPDARHPVRRLEKAVARVLVPAYAHPAAGRARAWLARISPRAARYVDYLRLSKNRHTHDEWIVRAERHGFAPFGPAGVVAEPPLELLAFDRR